MNPRLPARALVGGVVCLAILGGMLVGHAWPLWTGNTVVLAASATGKGENHATGEYIRLSTPATRLSIDPAASEAQDATRKDARPADTFVQVVGSGWERVGQGPGWWRAMRGRVVFVQLHPLPDGTFAPVSVSFTPVSGATNLRGRVAAWGRGGQGENAPRTFVVDCGLAAYYLEEGEAQRVADALAKNGSLQMEVAIASSGRARIRRLLVNGQPVS